VCKQARQATAFYTDCYIAPCKRILRACVIDRRGFSVNFIVVIIQVSNEKKFQKMFCVLLQKKKGAASFDQPPFCRQTFGRLGTTLVVVDKTVDCITRFFLSYVDQLSVTQ
jgi:hypothetical protein